MSLAVFLNHNSYAIAAALGLGILAVEIVRRRPTWRMVGLFAAVAALLVTPPLYVRSASSVAGDPDVVAHAIAAGKPTLLEVYSDF